MGDDQAGLSRGAGVQDDRGDPAGARGVDGGELRVGGQAGGGLQRVASRWPVVIRAKVAWRRAAVLGVQVPVNATPWRMAAAGVRSVVCGIGSGTGAAGPGCWPGTAGAGAVAERVA